MAVNVTGVPLGAESVVGLMPRPVITAAVTVMPAAGEAIPFSEDVTVVTPNATPVATPVVLLTEAITVLPDDQLTWLVILAVVPSE